MSRGIVLLVDAETGVATHTGFKVDAGSVEAQVLRELRRMNEHVRVLPFDGHAVNTLREIRPRVVFNLTEWIDGDRTRDHEIVRALQRVGLRYTGADARCLQLCRDKPAVNRKLQRAGIDVPNNFVIKAGARAPTPKRDYPLFVKPAQGDGSDHIGRKALVRTASELRERVRVLRAKGVGDILCEEYVDGRDVFVGLLGTPLRALPPLALVIGKRSKRAPRFATAALKHNPAYGRHWQLRYRELEAPAGVLRHIAHSSTKVARVLNLRGYARLDFRLTADHRLVFIEANPNPDLGRHTFGRERCFAGVAYADLIRRIVTAACRR